MCGVLSMQGLVPISVLQSVLGSSSETVRVLKKLHLFSAGQQKETEFCQRYKWCIHVRRQQALKPKVRFLNFISSFIVVPFPTVTSSEIQNYACIILCTMHNTDGCLVSCRGLICGKEGRESNPVLSSLACYLFHYDQCANESNQRAW